LLIKGVYEAARKCLAEFGGYRFTTDEENSIRGGGSRVDFVAMVDGHGRALCEAKSPSVMKEVGKRLPVRGIELEWIRSQSLVRRILSKVSTLFFVRYNVGYNKIYVVRVVSGSETDGMAVPFLP